MATRKKIRNVGATYENLSTKQRIEILIQNVRTLFEEINNIKSEIKSLKK